MVYEIEDLKINRKVHKHVLFLYATQLTCRKNLLLRIQSMSLMIVGFNDLLVCLILIFNFCLVIFFRLRKSKDGKMPKLPKTRKEAVKIGVPEIYKSTEESGPFLRYVAIVQLKVYPNVRFLGVDFLKFPLFVIYLSLNIMLFENKLYYWPICKANKFLYQYLTDFLLPKPTFIIILTRRRHSNISISTPKDYPCSINICNRYRDFKLEILKSRRHLF